MKIKKVCPQCGKIFWNSRYREKVQHIKTCSRICSGKYRRFKRDNLICKVCGKSFEVLPSRTKIIGRFAPKYCSKECQTKARTIRKETACKICGKKYFSIPSRDHSRYCSRECAYHGVTYSMPKKCEYCGAIFFIKPAQKKRFCNRICSNKSQIGKKKKSRPGVRGGLITKICEGCEQEFTSERYRKYKYCSRKCMGYGARKNRIITCKNCGKDFVSPRYRADGTKKRPGAKFCSILCAMKYRSIKLRENWPIKFCFNCGKEITFRGDRRNNYCSRKCGQAPEVQTKKYAKKLRFVNSQLITRFLLAKNLQYQLRRFNNV